MFTVDLYVQYLTTIVVEFILHDSMTDFTFYKSKSNINNAQKIKEIHYSLTVYPNGMKKKLL